MKVVRTKKSDKRTESSKQYIDKLQENNAKLNIVRVDLSYKKPYSDDVTLEKANKDLERMFNNRRSKPTIFKDQLGYLCQREYTKEKGVHFHAIFIYDGQKIQKSAFKADQIGEYWGEITKEQGSYHNCHRNTYNNNGIGMIDYKDKAKRKNLDKAISYLCKDDAKQDIVAIQGNKQSRAFTRGIVPKSKGNLGRPRSV